MHVAPVGRLLSDDLLLLRGIAAGLRLEPKVLDHVLGRLHDDAALLVETFAARAPADLLEVADGEDRRLLAIEFAEPREEHRPNGHVHADAERVGAADDLEEPFLRELLYEQAVLRKEPRVMHADAVTDEALDLLAVRRVETRTSFGERLRDLLLLLLRAVIHAHEVLRLFG